MPRHVRHVLLLIVLGGLVQCSETTAPPTDAVTVTVSTDATVILPGQSVNATITVEPSGNARVDYLKINTTGVLTTAESIAVNLQGSYTVRRAFHAPIQTDSGTIDILATASAAGALGNGDAKVTVGDTAPPVLQPLTVTPPDSLQPGDSLVVAMSAGDNVAITYSVIRITGALTYSDSIDNADLPYLGRTVRLKVPSTASTGTVTVSARVADEVGHIVTTTAPTLTLKDTRPPALTATIANSRGTPGFAPGDTLILGLAARDNARLAMVGYQLGSPAAVRDSFATTDSAFSQTVKLPVPNTWTGTSTYAVFARDASGNTRQELVGTFTVANRTRQAPWSVPLDANVHDIAYDLKRNLLYLSEPDSSRVAVLSISGQGFDSSFTFPAAGIRDIDLTLGGDSLLVAERNTPYLAVLNLTNGARDTLRVTTSSFLNNGPDNLRVMGNNKALVTLTFDGSGYGGTVAEVDLASRKVVDRLTVTEFVPLCRSADRSTALILIDDSCCPIEGVVYDALTGTFPADAGTVSQYFNYTAADYIGGHFLISGALFDRNLASLGNRTPANGSGVALLAPDGTSAYFATTTGVSRVRLSDAVVTDSISLGAQPYRLAISPDGLTLVAATTGNLFVVDLW